MKKFSVVLAVLLMVMMLGSTWALADAAPEYGGPLDPFPQLVEVNVMREFNSSTWYPEGESAADNILTRFYTDKLNIHYNVEWEVEKGTMTDQLNLAIASNDLPDVFVADAAQIYRMAKAGQIQPLTSAWTDYASDACRAELEGNDMMYFNPVTVDGEIYGIPCPEDFSLYLPFVWVRADWLKELGMEDYQINTVDDVIELARIFMTHDFDGNGVDDSVGIALDNTLNKTLNALGHEMGQYVNLFVRQEDGTLTYSDIQPGMKELLAKMHTWYEEGLFDKEFAVKDETKTYETLSSGRCGIYCQSFAVRGPFTQTKQANENAEWKCYPIPARKQDGAWAVGAEPSCFKWVCVRADYGYPEVAVKQHNLWWELWQGEYAEYFHGLNLTDYAQAGEDFKLYPPFWWDPPYKNYHQGEVFPTAWDNQDRDSIESPETRKQYDRSYDYFYNGNKTLYTGWTNMHLFYMAFPTIREVYGLENTVYDAYNGPVTEVIAQVRDMCSKTRLTWITKFIVGTADIEKDWDTYVDEWMNVGGAKMLDEINAWYAQRQ